METLTKVEETKVCKGGAEYKNGINEWLKWAATPHTEEEIREKCLTDFHNVCFSFLCEHSQLSCDFIEELMLLSTGILTKENYFVMHDLVRDTVLSHNGVEGVSAEEWVIEESATHIKATEMSNKSGGTRYIRSKNVNDRLDWFALCKYQKLTEEFMRKYNKCLNWTAVKSNQSYSNEFSDTFKKELSGRSKKINNV